MSEANNQIGEATKLNNHIYVFGAHSRGRTTARYLTELYPDATLLGYLIDNDEVNEAAIGGVPVIDFRKTVISELDISASVYIGTRGANFPHAAEVLTERGFSDIHPVDLTLDTELRTKYFKKRFAAEGKAFTKIEDISDMGLEAKGKPVASKASTDCPKGMPSAYIFEVRSAYDKPLQKDVYMRMPYEKSIQVGTVLTNIRLDECEYRDNEGDNISSTNRQLCEITALYWIWKHTDFDITGLVHYRRHFLLPDGWEERMAANGVDIILPLPLYIEPSVEENYRFRHVSADWDYLLSFLKEHHKDQMPAARECFDGTYYFPCNMFVMKRNVFEEYCRWLFPILSYVIEKVGDRDDVYQNRYPAFMAERLLTLFCHINQDRLKIVFADKNFLE